MLQYQILDKLELESGLVMKRVPVAYNTWGKLNKERNNVMMICHALTGSSDITDWWKPLFGNGMVFDPNLYFIICINTLGSPYGSASPLTVNSLTNSIYGPDFPYVTIRDTVKMQKMLLDIIGISDVCVAIGGSMGGMQVLEWGIMYPKIVKCLIPIACSGRHNAWAISSAEIQRLCITNDPNFHGGEYYKFGNKPIHGLAIARMNALLTYRSAESFNRRFKRNIQTRTSKLFPSSFSLNSTPFSSVHLECNLNEQERNQERILTSERKATENAQAPEEIHKLKYSISEHFSRSQHFATESYLHYQGEKFSNRFDANCYLTLSYMLDSHDISRGRGDYHEVLKSINQPTLIIGISSDGLFPINEQEELHENIPNSELSVVVSDEGHDGFLICFDDISRILSSWLRFRK